MDTIFTDKTFIIYQFINNNNNNNNNSSGINKTPTISANETSSPDNGQIFNIFMSCLFQLVSVVTR